MTVYIGLIVVDQIVSKLRYDQCLKEIIHFLNSHEQEVQIS